MTLEHVRQSLFTPANQSSKGLPASWEIQISKDSKEWECMNMLAGTAGLLFLQINPNLRGTTSDKPVCFTVKLNSQVRRWSSLLLLCWECFLSSAQRSFDSVALIQEQMSFNCIVLSVFWLSQASQQIIWTYLVGKAALSLTTLKMQLNKRALHKHSVAIEEAYLEQGCLRSVYVVSPTSQGIT